MLSLVYGPNTSDNDAVITALESVDRIVISNKQTVGEICVVAGNLLRGVSPTTNDYCISPNQQQLTHPRFQGIMLDLLKVDKLTVYIPYNIVNYVRRMMYPPNAVITSFDDFIKSSECNMYISVIRKDPIYIAAINNIEIPHRLDVVSCILFGIYAIYTRIPLYGYKITSSCVSTFLINYE